jgi:hypothetical protein
MSKAKKIKSKEVETPAPTLETSNSFTQFMDAMAQRNNIQSETVLTQDARSEVLMVCASVLQANAEAVMHLATIANTAPNFAISQSQHLYPVE